MWCIFFQSVALQCFSILLPKRQQFLNKKFIGPLKAIESFPTCLHNAQYRATKTFKMAATSSFGFWVFLHIRSHTLKLTHSLTHLTNSFVHSTSQDKWEYTDVWSISNHNNKKGRQDVRKKKRFLVRESRSQDRINVYDTCPLPSVERQCRRTEGRNQPASSAEQSIPA